MRALIYMPLYWLGDLFLWLDWGAPYQWAKRHAWYIDVRDRRAFHFLTQ